MFTELSCLLCNPTIVRYIFLTVIITTIVMRHGSSFCNLFIYCFIHSLTLFCRCLFYGILYPAWSVGQSAQETLDTIPFTVPFV